MKLKPFFVLPLMLLAFAFSSFNIWNDFPENDDPFVVVLDAGHGGHDPGNLGNGYLEKNIALNIVLKVGSILEQDPDIKVIYTRNDDTFVDLYVRGEIANKANADLFVSVHCDSHTSDAHGAGTFVLGLHANKQNFDIAKKENSVIYLEDNYETKYADYDINSPESVIGLTIMQEEFLDQSILLAKTIQGNFANKLKRNDRKVKQAGFIVLHQTFMPSVLVETGFLTNKTEGAYLNSKKGQADMGQTIADAIINYKGTVQANIASTGTENIPSVVQTTEEPKEEIVQKPVDETIKPKLETAPNDVIEIPAIEEVITVEEPKAAEVAIEVEKEPAEKVMKNSEAPDPIIEVIPAKSGPSIIFKVQLLASSKDIALQANNFKGLNRLSKEPFKNLFRYMYGSTSSYEEAKMLKMNADVKGYATSYIVAYKDGQRITMPEALKYISK